MRQDKNTFRRRADGRPIHDAPGRGAPRAAERAPLAGAKDRRPLFPPLSRGLCRDMEGMLARALDRACPLKQAHRRDLPANILQLSRLLTVDRAEMRRPYWASPALSGAYVHYFLPWNIYRLARLFSGLRPQAPGDGAHLLLDLGSGPLTVPLALWLSCPEWRTKKIVVAAVDRAGHPMQTGRAIMEHLAAEAGVEPWETHLIQAPLEQGPRRAAELVRRGAAPWLVTAANVLNELPPARRRRLEEDGEDDEEEQQDRDETRLGDLLIGVHGMLRRGPEGARALFVEPGTRLGGLTLMGLRAMAREDGMRLFGPCTHAGLCPLRRGDDDGLYDGEDGGADGADILGVRSGRETRGAVSKLAGRAWCHFTFTGEGAPGWLRALAEPTGLAKETLSLAWLALGAHTEAAAEAAAEAASRGCRLRVISQPFPVPGRGRCRYACSAAGLVLLERAEGLASGTELTLDIGAAAVAAGPEDARSGARCLALEGAAADAGDGRAAAGRPDGEARRGRGDAGPARENAGRGAGREEEGGSGRPDRERSGRPGRPGHGAHGGHGDGRRTRGAGISRGRDGR